MSGAGRWWPLSQGDVSRASAAVSAVLDAWAAQWVAHRVDLSVGAATTPASDGARCWHSTAVGIDLRLNERGWNRLVRRALDLPQGVALPLGGASFDVVEAFSRTMLADLLERLGEGLRIPDLVERRIAPRERSSDTIVLAIGIDDDDPLLHLEAKGQWVRDSFGPTSPSVALPEAARLTAFEATTVAIAAIVGSSDISALEFSELAIGDVLVTTTALDQPLRLAVHAPGTPTSPLGEARPVRRDGRVALVIESIH